MCKFTGEKFKLNKNRHKKQGINDKIVTVVPESKQLQIYIIYDSQRWALDIFFIIRYRWFDNFFPVNRLR